MSEVRNMFTDVAWQGKPPSNRYSSSNLACVVNRWTCSDSKVGSVTVQKRTLSWVNSIHVQFSQHTRISVISIFDVFFYLICFQNGRLSRSFIPWVMFVFLVSLNWMVLFPTGTRYFSLHYSVETGSGATPAFYPMSKRLYPEDKAAGAWSWSPSRAEVSNVRVMSPVHHMSSWSRAWLDD
jgi:hypothetical protein